MATPADGDIIASESGVTAGETALGETMFKVKKCANCGTSSWNLLFDREISVSCQGCGQVYPQASIKRLPDDLDAFKRLKISVEPATTIVSTLPQIAQR